jgi:hypothetical protein
MKQTKQATPKFDWPMPSPLRHSILFESAVGRQWVDIRFTALSLVYGRPPETVTGSEAAAFFNAFEKVFGFSPIWKSSHDSILAWINAYRDWYAQEELHARQHTAQETKL